MSEKRKSVSKKLRFDVFKRDLFKCQYCGSVPPNTVLEVDHITPVCQGGKNNIDNLLTSCFDCNRGKGKIELSVMPDSTNEKAILLKEKVSQYKAFIKLQDELEGLISCQIDKVNDVFRRYFEKLTLSPGFKSTSVKKFIKALGVYEVVEAMESACAKIDDADDVVKYFCGICWSKIREL